jgi:hypothetical protein
MRQSDYYAFRRGQERPTLPYTDLRRLVAEACISYEREGWFQIHLGKDCVDHPKDVGAYVLEELGQAIWPLHNLRDLEEDWLFTAIEFLYAHISKPTETWFHRWNGCGIHVLSGNDEEGRREFRERMNGILGRYVPAFELRENGEVWQTPPFGLEDLAPEPTGTPNIDDRVREAVSRYRRHGASEEEKRQAVRDLADVLEYLRSTVGTGVPSKDEGYLFDIANNFAIRHHNPRQRTDYDRGIWLDWIFYAFLNAIALASRLIARADSPDQS